MRAFFDRIVGTKPGEDRRRLDQLRRVHGELEQPAHHLRDVPRHEVGLLRRQRIEHVLAVLRRDREQGQIADLREDPLREELLVLIARLLRLDLARVHFVERARVPLLGELLERDGVVEPRSRGDLLLADRAHRDHDALELGVRTRRRRALCELLGDTLPTGAAKAHDDAADDLDALLCLLLVLAPKTEEGTPLPDTHTDNGTPLAPDQLPTRIAHAPTPFAVADRHA